MFNTAHYERGIYLIMDNIYERLANKLDTIGKGFPHTESGAEFVVLQNRFSPQDAAYAVELSGHEWELPIDLAARMGKNTDTVAADLYDMSFRGLIYRMRREDKVYYRVMPMMLGLMELQLNKGSKDPEYLQNMGAFIGGGLGASLVGGETPVLRFIPVNKNLVNDNKVLITDDAVAILNKVDRISVMPCICRQMAGHCDYMEPPFETCMGFDDWADFFVENGDARYISREEAINIQKRAEEKGFLTLTPNSEDAKTMCSCCSCCCGIINMMNGFNNTSRKFAGNYYCEKDDSKCINCGTCVKRCAMGAHAEVDGVFKYDMDRCVGCGLCVSTCPTKALTLKIKSDEKLAYLPKTPYELFEIAASERTSKS